MPAGRLLVATVLLAACATLPAGGALAQRAAQAADAATLHLAHSLVRYGDRRKDALALIAAARILASAGVRERASGKVPPQVRQKTDMSVQGVVARAKVYAGGRADLVALADDAATGTRGNAEGPVRMFAMVPKTARDTFEFDFRGGEAAFVGVSGDGDSDLDLYVYDAAGKLVCAAEGETDEEICRWFPKAAGRYRVVIRNLGIENQYFLATN